MQFLAPIISIVVGFLSFVLVLRTWMQFCQVSAYLPLSQSLLRLTAPMVNPVSKFIPTVKNINFAALLIALALLAVEKGVLGLPLTMAVLVGLLGIIKMFGQILFFTTLIRALMSWVTRGDHPLDEVIAQITEPVLGIIRKILPRTGMLDFSVMVLGFGLLLLNNLFYSVFGAFWAVA
ncbi:hypothetical protein A6046_01685 [[Haemophilus] ducreyi]|uniref:Integral membrane protein n=2 Tax=Haemophilus ducreyi TaxID=730 RepID=Q7VN16_HAEDU|nr:YggT family protein [[Haemophilus] ducreyi]AAP95682.1 hypothetical protein HD_0777 [[Haemophilus] ducreyi 35000HP]AKO30746.1 membrane protein [[Haemophilus] ducreyi]AKO32184.1 membrane protein [[Haemophilus] ducreyi]AKO33638.1 membrane protein [[Haemophilus] ducreyi]AKO35085.1 membrane protein [[Haemophilus] ducreyi]